MPRYSPRTVTRGGPRVSRRREGVALPLELVPSRTGSHPPSTLLCSIGRDYRFKQHNPAWESLLGLTTQEVRAKSFLDCLHPDNRPRALEEFHRLGAHGEAVSFDARVTSG